MRCLCQPVMTTLGFLATGAFQRELANQLGLSQSTLSRAMPAVWDVILFPWCWEHAQQPEWQILQSRDGLGPKNGPGHSPPNRPTVIFWAATIFNLNKQTIEKIKLGANAFGDYISIMQWYQGKPFSYYKAKTSGVCKLLSRAVWTFPLVIMI